MIYNFIDYFVPLIGHDIAMFVMLNSSVSFEFARFLPAPIKILIHFTLFLLPLHWLLTTSVVLYVVVPLF